MSSPSISSNIDHLMSNTCLLTGERWFLLIIQAAGFGELVGLLDDRILIPEYVHNMKCDQICCIC